jgi:hypothetical protein
VLSPMLQTKGEMVKFTVLPARTRVIPQASGAYLVTDDWDDFGYRTQFFLQYRDADGVHEIGNVRIGRLGMGDGGRPGIPRQFEVLGEEFFSLGQDASYYAALREFGPNVRDTVLRSLRDAALDLTLFDRASDEPVFETSLMRSLHENTVRWQFHRIAVGDVPLTSYRFEYRSPPLPGGGAGLRLAFHVEPGSRPPTNIHALIGSNGVGKTRLLNRMARAAADEAATRWDIGTVVHLDLNGARLPDSAAPPFANIVSVSFSYFDAFTPLRQRGDIEHTYVSVNLPPGDGSRAPRLKDREALVAEFIEATQRLTGAARRRWEQALASLETDPLFRDAEISAGTEPSAITEDEAREMFDSLSSGHKIVLLAMTHLADLVAERTLVLIDEPETHLHPPLLSAFVRALSDLLFEQNGVAVVATHSPVVLQELPSTCVWVLSRAGSHVTAARPELETFGENVGILTRVAFGLEVTRSGFHDEIETLVGAGLSYEQVVDQFGGQLGGEARAIARALVAARNRQAPS